MQSDREKILNKINLQIRKKKNDLTKKLMTLNEMEHRELLISEH